MNSLTVVEKDELLAHEVKIEEKLRDFYEVGTRLLAIRDKKLYRENYASFEEYCSSRWKFSAQQGYHLAIAASVVSDLQTDILPAKATHARELAILDSDQRNLAWEEAVQTAPGKITADWVATVARKHYVITNNPILGEKIQRQEIVPDRAYKLQRALERFPLWRERLIKHGLQGEGIDPTAIYELRNMSQEFPEEVEDILTSGHLDTVPLYEVTIRDVLSFWKHLQWEKSQQKKELVAAIQNEIVRTPTTFVADGPMSLEELVNRPDQTVGFLFPGDLNPATLGRVLKKYGYKVFMVCVAKGDPAINFDGLRVPISRVNGVKPKLVTDFISNLL